MFTRTIFVNGQTCTAVVRTLADGRLTIAVRFPNGTEFRVPGRHKTEGLAVVAAVSFASDVMPQHA